MSRPTATPAASSSWRTSSAPPVTTLVGVGDTCARKPDLLGDQPAAQGVVRVGDDQHVVEAALAEQVGDAAQRLVARVALVLEHDRLGRHAALDEVGGRRLASVKRSPGRLPPVTTTSGARPCGHSSTTWSRRAASCGDGSPSYCAAPITTMASTGRAWSLRPVDHTWYKLTTK